MKQKLFTTNFYASLFAAGLLFTSFTVSAQVKIGLNPTTIGANSNLEVEGTGGYKTTVDKNGKVTIFDGTQGNDKVFTSDPNGVGSWKAPVTNAQVMVSVNGAQSITGFSRFNFTAESYDRGNNFDLATDIFTAPSDGLYLFNIYDNIGNNFYYSYAAFGSLNRTGGQGILEAGNFNLLVDPQEGQTGTITTFAYLTAGAQVVYEVSSNVGNVARVRAVVLQVVKLSN